MTTALVDSSFLYALHSYGDRHHRQALSFIENNDYSLLISEVTLTEVTFLLEREGGPLLVSLFLERFFASGYTLYCLSPEDITRAGGIMRQYVDSHFDFVDTALMALAERLNITHICTYDRRDFSIFRPQHCAYFQLLP